MHAQGAGQQPAGLGNEDPVNALQEIVGASIGVFWPLDKVYYQVWALINGADAALFCKSVMACC